MKSKTYKIIIVTAVTFVTLIGIVGFVGLIVGVFQDSIMLQGIGFIFFSISVLALLINSCRMLIESCRTSQRDVNGQIHTLEANDTITRQSYLQNPTQPCKNYTTEGHVDMGYVCLEQKIISSAQTFALPKLNESLIFQNENSARNIQTLALGEPHQGIYTTLPRISAHTEGNVLIYNE